MNRDTRVVDDIEFHRVTNDINGNPRYVTHFLSFAPDWPTARDRANRLGFSVYRAKWFGGGFVGQSYNLRETAKLINELRAGDL